MRGRARPGLIRDFNESKPVTYVELFFDLVYVFTIFRLSQTLLTRLNWVGLFETAVLLLTVWWVWAYTNLLTDTLDARLIRLQLLVIFTAFGSLLLATAIPEAFEQRGLLFAIAYLAINLGRSVVLAIALRRHIVGLRPRRAALWFLISGVPWLVGAEVDGTPRLVLWGIAILIDYLTAEVGWPAPRIGRTAPNEWNLASEHFAERYRQFVIVALGQTIASTGAAFHASDFTLHQGSAFTVSFLITVLLYWIYFHRTREKLGPTFSGAREPSIRAREAGFAHLLMVAGVVGITVSDELVIRGAAHRVGAYGAAVSLGGAVLFILGHALLGRHVFIDVATPRLIGAGVLLLASPLLVGLPMLAVSGAVAVVLAGIVIWDLLRTGEDLGEQTVTHRL
ncbi:low temperature requirement protein A [Micromonospora sp. NPDC049559]|uniref:low temperature requirement protein A n=1 Tax=Micromonospora sp. NPDC049559 TaxID=3155923 RepID=UPI00343C269E